MVIPHLCKWNLHSHSCLISYVQASRCSEGDNPSDLMTSPLQLP